MYQITAKMLKALLEETLKKKREIFNNVVRVEELVLTNGLMGHFSGMQL